ncbi:MAG TPA: iron-containing redox enzyme family protein [Acidimicrobiales bacterium]|nr:iron-containing redox enzyme family protein [Acidimicrobiales bacterium]
MPGGHVVLSVDDVADASTLSHRIDAALRSGALEGLAGEEPRDQDDAMCALLTIYDLWLSPLPSVDGRERFQNHPVIAELKWRLEQRFLARLAEWVPEEQLASTDAAAALRRIARMDTAPVYDWLATSATWEELVRFLAIEGGPDGGFDDLVAVCQVGITGPAKVVLGANFWDEMGGGDPDEVHTVLHDRLVAAMGLERVPVADLPPSALDRSALNGLLATNRWLQPEMIGALGLLELQAGPRCRAVLRALHRLQAPADAFPFYEEHADTDPRHGKEWLDGAVAPLVDAHPEWGPRIVRGARWRAELNGRLFADVHRLLTTVPVTVPA